MITGADEIVYSIALVILILMSAFFSGTETAYMRANRFRLRTLADKGNTRAKLVEDILKEPERLISAILLGNNFVNVLASAIATALFLSFFGERGILYATIAMTVLLLVFGEITPKTIAAYRPDMVTLLFSRPVRLIILLLNPFIRVFTLLARGVLMLFGLKPGKHPEFSEEDVGSVISMGHKEGFLPASKAKMMAAIMELDEVPVRKVMLPLPDMVLISLDSTFDEVLKVITTKSFSRYPVYKDAPDNIVGYLHIRDIWAHLDRRDAFQVKDCLREAHFVPETKSIFTQLVDFQDMRLHMAFVVDEYGTVKGGITLEDIIEEITGDIADEHDALSAHVIPVTGGFIVRGNIGLRDLGRYMDRDFPEEYDTLSGLIYEQLDRIPAEGDVITWQDMTFNVERMRGNRVSRVRITVAKPE